MIIDKLGFLNKEKESDFKSKLRHYFAFKEHQILRLNLISSIVEKKD